jgi:hypothetical protein
MKIGSAVWPSLLACFFLACGGSSPTSKPPTSATPPSGTSAVPAKSDDVKWLERLTEMTDAIRSAQEVKRPMHLLRSLDVQPRAILSGTSKDLLAKHQASVGSSMTSKHAWLLVCSILDEPSEANFSQCLAPVLLDPAPQPPPAFLSKISGWSMMDEGLKHLESTFEELEQGDLKHCVWENSLGSYKPGEDQHLQVMLNERPPVKRWFDRIEAIHFESYMCKKKQALFTVTEYKQGQLRLLGWKFVSHQAWTKITDRMRTVSSTTFQKPE